MRDHRPARFRDRRLVDDLSTVRSTRAIALEDDVANVPSRPSMCPDAKGDDRVFRRAYDKSNSKLVKGWVRKEDGLVITALELPDDPLAPLVVHVLCVLCAQHYIAIVDRPDDKDVH
jgi:hypothetical protein